MIKRVVAEAIGTFFVVFCPCALSASTLGAARPIDAALVSGLAVSAMIFALGPICGAHFNPAVTLGFAAARRFPLRALVWYWLGQALGAIAAAASVFFLFGYEGGVQKPATGNLGFAVAVEALITFLLMFVIIAMATDRRTPAGMPAIGIGLAVVAGVEIGLPVTGGSMNPFRAMGPALFGDSAARSHLWIYFVGPGLGAVVAALAYEFIRLDKSVAQSVPADL